MELCERDERILDETASRLSQPGGDALQSCQFLHEVLLEDFPAEVFLQRPAILEAILNTFDSPDPSRLGMRRDKSSLIKHQQAAMRSLVAICRRLRLRQYQCLDIAAALSPPGVSRALDRSEPMAEIVTLSHLVVACVLPWTTKPATAVAATSVLRIALQLMQPDAQRITTPLRDCCKTVVNDGLQLFLRSAATETASPNVVDSVTSGLLEVVCLAFDLGSSVSSDAAMSQLPPARAVAIVSATDSTSAVLKQLVGDAFLRQQQPQVHATCLAMLREVSAEAASQADDALYAVQAMESALEMIATNRLDAASWPERVHIVLQRVWDAIPGLHLLMPACVTQFMAMFLSAASHVEQSDADMVFLAREQLLCLLSNPSLAVRLAVYQQLQQAVDSADATQGLLAAASGIDYVFHLLMWGMSEQPQMRAVAAWLLGRALGGDGENLAGQGPVSREKLDVARAVSALAFALLEEPELGDRVQRLLGAVVALPDDEVPVLETSAILMRCLFHRDPRIRLWGFSRLVGRYGRQLQGAGEDVMVLPSRAVQGMLRDAGTAALLPHRPEQARDLHSILLNGELDEHVRAAAAQQLALVTHKEQHCVELAQGRLHEHTLALLADICQPLFAADASDFIARWDGSQVKAAAAYLCILQHLLLRVPGLRAEVSRGHLPALLEKITYDLRLGRGPFPPLPPLTP